MTEKVLLYHFKGTDEAKRLQPVLLRMGIRVKMVEPEEYGVPLGILAGIKDFQPEEGGKTEPEAGEEDFPEQMMVMCGLAGNRVDELLNRMKKGGVPRIALKAMLTPTNQFWNSRELYHELKMEHEAMSKMQQERKGASEQR